MWSCRQSKRSIQNAKAPRPLTTLPRRHGMIFRVPESAGGSGACVWYPICYIVRYIMSKPPGHLAAAFPWTGRQRFFEPGEIRLAILSMLSEYPKHGYQLMKEMEHRSGGMYRASAGSTYPTLQQLEADGMVEAEMQCGRRVYRLTKTGRKEVTRDRIVVKRIWARAEACEDWGQA